MTESQRLRTLSLFLETSVEIRNNIASYKFFGSVCEKIMTIMASKVRQLSDNDEGVAFASCIAKAEDPLHVLPRLKVTTVDVTSSSVDTTHIPSSKPNGGLFSGFGFNL